MALFNFEKLSTIFSFNLESVPKPSTIGFKYPTFRDGLLRTGENWLMGKREDDRAEGLWRVHDGLYDLADFIKSHPGGPEWLELTKGTDITEAFESHHLTLRAENMLPKFFIRKAAAPRNSPFTFKEDGFYKTLKVKVREVLQNVPDWPKQRSKLLTDFLLCGYLLLAIASAYMWSFVLGALAGIFLACTANAAHNFFHQKDNFRMYYFDMCLMSSRSWRISHSMSHHMYTNTIQDLEISSIEPWFQYLPADKHIFFRYLSWLYSPIVYAFMFIGQWTMETIQCIKSKNASVVQFLPFTVPLLMYLITGHSILWVGVMYLWVILTGSLYFGIVGVNAAHHHPGIFHDGDTPRPREELDWGIHEMDAVMDREEITGSHFLVLTNFGDHALHHLFPTVDHGVLEYLYPVFKQTCEEFGVKFRMTTQWKLIRGQFRQLAKIEPNPNPPKPLKPNSRKRL